MLSVDTATALAAAGIAWEPRTGDRFTIRSPELFGVVFWVSDLTIDVRHFADSTLLAFNGTTEWALDSVELDKTLWLPREDQLRELIGSRLVALVRVGEGWRVEYVRMSGGSVRSVASPDPEEAYAGALLDIAEL